MDMNEQRENDLQDWGSCFAPTTPYRPIVPRLLQQHKSQEYYIASNAFAFGLQATEGNHGAGPSGAGNTLEMSRNVACEDLLALAPAASNAADDKSVMHGQLQSEASFPSHLLYDLNLLPETTYGGFVPITPGKAISNADHKKDQDIEEHMNSGAGTVEIIDLENDKDPAESSSHATISTQLQQNQIQVEENHYIVKGGNDNIDLNKAPQFKQKRRKHRPKVVREGKPKTIPKPSTPKEKPVRRKYVRKNALEKDATPPKELQECVDSNKLKSTKRSCRTALNYVMEEPSSVSNTCTNEIASKSTVELGSMVDNTRIGFAHELVCSSNQWPKDFLALPEQQAPRNTLVSGLVLCGSTHIDGFSFP